MNDSFAGRILGDWTGTMRLYTSWLPDREHPSASKLSIRSRAQGKFLELAYDWAYEGAQEGVLLLGHDAEKNVATAAWIDTWHQSTRIMACTGSQDAANTFTLRGSFEVENSPDWHWRIAIAPVSDAELRMVMHNIPPDGKEDLAVRAEYRRRD